MAIDRRSSLLASGNNIDESRIHSEISSFTFSDVYNKSDQSDLYSNLGLANAIILTNADRECFLRPEPPKYPEDDDYDDDNIVLKKKITGRYEYQSSLNSLPETWFFKSYTTGFNGKIDLQETVPLTLTSYIISGFSINPELGFGLAEPKQLGAFQDFFLEISLPSSAFVNDVIKVEVYVFNYLTTFAIRKTIIKLQKNENFDVLTPDSERSCKMARTNNHRSEIAVEVNGASKTHFFIRPKKAGILKVTATVELDGLGEVTCFQKTFIDETGLREGKVKAKLYNLRERERESTYFDMSISDQAAEGSEQLEAFVCGNIMGYGNDIKM